MNELTRRAACRGCGAEIAFIKTVKGKTMPVDPIPHTFVPAGGPNTYVMTDGSISRGREMERGEKEGTQIGYISHFASCPAADSFRKR